MVQGRIRLTASWRPLSELEDKTRRYHTPKAEYSFNSCIEMSDSISEEI